MPASAYVWLVLALLPVPPSPRSHAWLVIVPSGSWEALASKLTSRGVLPVWVGWVKLAIGAWLAGGLVTVTVACAFAVAPLSSATSREMPYVPALA